MIMIVNSVIAATVPHIHLDSHVADSIRNRLLGATDQQLWPLTAVQHRGQLLAKTFPSKTVQVKVDGVVQVHQQKADNLHQEITRRIDAGRR